MGSPRHEAALAYAKAGIPIFPCRPNSKLPATPNGFKDASTDEQIINGWWSQADYNLAVEPERAGWAVIDEDGEPDRDWPPTFKVRTPRGGIHRYFTGSIASTVKKLGPHTDTRGIGSYVLLPPSVVDGKPYTVIEYGDEGSAHTLRPLPAGVAAEAEAKPDQIVERPNVELDQPHNIDRARQMVAGWIASGRVAIEGAGGDNMTYRCASDLRDLGLSADVAYWRLIPWNHACLPPWNLEELRVKVENAFAYGQNSAGAWATEDPVKTFEAVAASVRASSPRSRFHFADEPEMELEPEATWLFPELLPKVGVALLVGPQSSYKSFIALHWALCIGSHLNDADPDGAAFYACLEGRRGIAGERRRAWKLLYQCERVSGFFLGRAPAGLTHPDCSEFIDQIHARTDAGAKPRLIVLDTHARCMSGLDETSAKDTGVMMRFATDMMEEFGCCVLIIHHTNKNGETRGSTALEAGCDTVLRVEADHKARCVKMVCTKQKDAPERERPWFWRLEPLGGSLVLQDIEREEYERLTMGVQPYSGAVVGKALKDLNATTATPVSGAVLAETLLGGKPKDGQSLEEYQASAAFVERQLTGLFRSGKLATYGSMVGRSVLWFLPPE